MSLIIACEFQAFLWGYLRLLGADGQGVLRKDAEIVQYDRSLFYGIEERKNVGKKLSCYRRELCIELFIYVES